MAVVVALYGAHQALGLGGRGADGLFDYWINEGLLWCAAIACVGGALHRSRSRAPWLLVALALASWAIGDTIWSTAFEHAAAPPQASICDVFWLAWYPLIVAALVLLVRERIPGFELHRWIDGVEVMLLVATLWVALFLVPVAEHSTESGLAVVLDFAYPLCDAVLVGAVLGVFVLMDWRPDRMWLTLGVALTVMGVADGISSVRVLVHPYERGVYDAVWVGAAILVAYSAWQPHPGRLERREVTGWRAIALAIAAQALAMSIQIYAIFDAVPRSERILTVIVLMIATIQIVVSRPRPRSNPPPERDPPGSRAPVRSRDREDASGAGTTATKANQLKPGHRSGQVVSRD